AAGASTVEISPLGEGTKVTVTATAPGVGSFITFLARDETADVNGPGVAAGTTLTVVGGDGFDLLSYNAKGAQSAAAAGAQPGEVIVSQPSAGSVDIQDFEQVTVLNSTSPATAFIIPAPVASAIAGQPVVDTVVTQFSADLLGDADQ